MPSSRTSQLGRDSLEAGQASLWPTRETYRDFRLRVGDILGTTKNVSRPTSPAIHRIMSDVETIKIDILNNNNRPDLVAAVLEKPAVKLARTPADSYIFVLFPGGSATVKDFNDELLGPELTNVLLDKRDQVNKETLKYFQLADEDNQISSNHKTCHYYITSDQLKKALYKLSESVDIESIGLQLGDGPIGSAEALKIISYVVQRIERDIQAAVLTILEARISDLLETPNSRDQINKIRAWQHNHLKNVKLSFGVSERINTVLGGEEALKNRFWADQQAEWSARRAEASTGRGEAFDLFKFIHEIDQVRTETLDDAELVDFFEEVDLGTRKELLLKTDVIHNLRKWTTTQKMYANDPAMMAKYYKLRRYYQTVNGIDYINPWVDTEHAFTAISHFEEVSESTDIDDLKHALLMDQRESKDCTPEYFHYQGTEFNSACYVSFDAIGIGDINARDIEITALTATQHLKTKGVDSISPNLKSELQNIIMTVGQRVSIDIKEKFAAARREIESTVKGCPVFTTRGGDEWHVLIGDPDRLDHDSIFTTIASIAQKHNLRATVSYKDTKAVEKVDLGVPTDLERVEAHFQALDNNELNNALIKTIEKAGLNGVVAIPGEKEHTAALIPTGDNFTEVSNIAAIAGAIKIVDERGLVVNNTNVKAVLEELQSNT